MYKFYTLLSLKLRIPHIDGACQSIHNLKARLADHKETTYEKSWVVSLFFIWLVDPLALDLMAVRRYICLGWRFEVRGINPRGGNYGCVEK